MSRIKDSKVFIHYDVLEHIPDPLHFLKTLYEFLPDGGRTIFVVPDSTEYIKNGDVGMCIHQHVNYFSVSSLTALVEMCGYVVDKLASSDTTGTILCVAKKPIENIFQSHSQLPELVEKETSEYFNKVRQNYFNVTKNIKKILLDENITKVGFYPPLRAIPYLSPLLEKHLDKIVFVDDNIKVNNKFICDIPIPIKTSEEAVNLGVDTFIICSKPFRKNIEKKLRSLLKEKAHVSFVHLDDFLLKV